MASQMWSDTLERCCQTLVFSPCCCLFSDEIYVIRLKKGMEFISSLFLHLKKKVSYHSENKTKEELVETGLSLL